LALGEARGIERRAHVSRASRLWDLAFAWRDVRASTCRWGKKCSSSQPVADFSLLTWKFAEMSKVHTVQPLKIWTLLFAWLIGLGLCCGLSGRDALAATVEDQQRLLAAMLHEPTNYDAAFEYVRVSEDLSDYEAAIGALERLLFYNPGLTRAQIELGMVYYRLGSYENALYHFKAASASPQLDPAVLPRLDAYASDTQKELQQSRFYGFLQTGLRYQSNAAALPDAGLIRILGVDVPTGTTAPQKADGNAFALVRLSHDFDFQNQRGDVLETRFYGYGTKQFSLSQFDFGYAEASIGPRFGLPAQVQGLSVKPYVVGNLSWIGGAQFLNSGGGGVNLRIQPTSLWSFEPGFEYRRISVTNPGIGPISALGNGDFYTVSLTGSYRFNQTFSLELRPLYSRASSVNAWQSFDQVGVDAGLRIEFDPPALAIPYRWVLTPYLRVAWAGFDAPDPTVDASVTRRDIDYRAGLLVDLPIAANFGFSGMLQYVRSNSNLPNFRYDDFSVLFGPTARF
jgi:tetratricopeptide (TPR) repeat protein